MKKKLCMILALSLVVVLQASLLLGCTGTSQTGVTPVEEKQTSAENTPAEEESTASGATDFSGRTFKLALFEGGYGIACWENIIEAFKAQHPGLEVEYQANPKIEDIVRPQMIAGSIPDFYYPGTENNTLYLSMQKENQLLDLTDVFEGPCYDDETVALKDCILDGVLESSICRPYGDDKIYAAALSASSGGLIYNKTLFAENGWEIPKTWDDFFALGDAAKEKGIALYTYPGVYPEYNTTMLMMALASAIGTDGLKDVSEYRTDALTSDEVLQVFQNIARIGSEGYLMTGTTGMNHTQSQSEFMLDKALFIVNGDWIAQEMRDAPRTDGFQWAMAPVPTLTDEDESYIKLALDVMCIPVGAQNADIAKEFIRFLYTDEVTRIFAKDAQLLSCTKNATEVNAGLLGEEFLSIHEVDKTVNSSTFAWKALPENCKVIIQDEVFQPLADVMNGEMTGSQWRDAVMAAFDKINAGE